MDLNSPPHPRRYSGRWGELFIYDYIKFDILIYMKQFILQAFVVAVFISLVLFFIAVIPVLLTVVVTIILVAYITAATREFLASRNK